MFKSIIYFNEDLIYQYGSLLSDSFKYDVAKIVKENDKRFNVLRSTEYNLGSVSANFKCGVKKDIKAILGKISI